MRTGMPGWAAAVPGAGAASGAWWHTRSQLDPSWWDRGGEQGPCLQQGLRESWRGVESVPRAAGQRGEPGPGTAPAPPGALRGRSESRGAGRVGKAPLGTAFFRERAGDEGRLCACGGEEKAGWGATGFSWYD